MLVSPSGIQGRLRQDPAGAVRRVHPVPQRSSAGSPSISKAASSNMIPGTGAHTLHRDHHAGRPARCTIGVLDLLRVRVPRHVPGRDGPGRPADRLPVVDLPTFQGTWGPDQHGIARGAARRGDRPPGRPGRADRGHGRLRRPRPGARLARPGRPAAWSRSASTSPRRPTETFYDQAGDYVMWTGVAITALAALVMLVRRRGFLGEYHWCRSWCVRQNMTQTPGNPCAASEHGSRSMRSRSQGKANLVSGRHRCRFTAFCRSIRRPRRCARTLSGQWRGPSGRLSACPGSASPLPQGLFVLS